MTAMTGSGRGALSGAGAGLGWFQIVRLGLVQTALGAIVVLTTSTLNRVMAVELALPAMLPGALVAWHYAVQMSRPRWGYGSDVGGRRTPWIIGGMAVLALGGALAAVATALMETALVSGILLAVLAFTLIGVGVGAAGTSLLVLLAKQVVPERRAAAATIVWVMMIIGFIITAATAGSYLDPFSTTRLVAVTAVVSVLAFTLAVVAVWGVERAPARIAPATVDASGEAQPAAPRPTFAQAMAEVWAEPKARRFTIFVALSMFAYSAQDLILEPYAGVVFGFTPGQSTKLSGTQHGGVLAGMILVALLATGFRGIRVGSLRTWTFVGCIASALALALIAVAGFDPGRWRLEPLVFMLGLANGAFAVAAIGSMMALAGEGREGREGVRMGLWGAAQAIAFGAGGAAGAGAADIVRIASGSALTGYTSVFIVEAFIFLAAAALALRIGDIRRAGETRTAPRVSDLGQSMLPQANELRT